jgi:coenzyme F420-0:L-glutamate ligase/coenzyme F420-1:gamma-L-glutamate ligase
MREIKILPVTVGEAIRPEATEGRSAGSFFCHALAENGIEPQDGDVLVVSSKVVAFFEEGLVRLEDVRASWKARFLGRAFGRDPQKLQILMETGKVLAVVPMGKVLSIPTFRRMMIERTPNPDAMLAGYGTINRSTFVVRAHAAYLDEAGIDYTNSPEGYVTVLPRDPCATARKVRRELRKQFGKDVAVIITDTVTCVGRVGSQDLAIGYAGIDPITRQTFSDDLFGVPRSGGIDIVIDSIAGMAGLVMGQTTERTPAVLVRGLDCVPERETDIEDGMRVLEYPPGVVWRAAMYVILATAWFRLVNVLTFRRWPRRTRAV